MVISCTREKGTVLKCLIFLISVFIMILVAIAIILINRKEDHNVCKSEYCIKHSAEIMRYIDKTADPCDDFHAYACANIYKNRKDPPVPSADEEINLMVADMVQTGDTKAFLMQKTFYLWCANVKAIEMNDDETLLELFSHLGEWPVMVGSSWNGTYFDWVDVAKKSRMLGLKFDWFLDFSIYEDVNDTRRNILKIDIPQYLTPFPQSEILFRQKLFTKVAVALGAPDNLAHYETGTTIDFETTLRKLAEEHRNKKQHRNATSLPKITINDVQQLWPYINWLDLINNITGIKMNGFDHVIFDEVLDYIKALNHEIHGKPKRLVGDYLMWTIVEEYYQYLSQPIRGMFEEYYQNVGLKKPERDRRKLCITESRKQFPLIAEAEYVRRYVTQSTKQLVEKMILIIRQKYEKLLNEASWMQRMQKETILFRLRELKVLIGGPDEVYDQYGFAESLGLYGFVFRSTDIIQMLAQRRRRYYEHYYSAVARPMTNRTVNYYSKFINSTSFVTIGHTIVIPASLLRESFVSSSLPSYVNFATLGKALCHEIFDYIFKTNSDTFYAQDTIDFTTSFEAINIFEKAINCLIRESSNFHITEVRRPEKMLQLLADFVASEVAYEAYKEWSLIYPQELKLPALEFTPEQLFWIHGSKLSCNNKIYSKHDRDYARFKVIGPLKNSRYFANDFNCLEGSKMTSKKKCKIL